MTVKFQNDQLTFIPLGGCGVFGANLSLYGYGGKWLMVDCGMGFGDDTMPGIDLLLPDISFLKQIKDDVLACIVTHGHEDHIGGIPYLWEDIGLPIYATPFTAGLIHTKIVEKSWGRRTEIKFLSDEEAIDLGPFKIETIAMAHSIPEMRALVIETDAGAILHTGDWKIDDEPVAGDRCDVDALKALADRNVLAVVGDSTNAMVPGVAGSEAKVQKAMVDVFAEYQNRIAVTCFSSNVARLVSIAKAAEESERSVSLVGRSLWRIEGVARQCGYLDGVPEFIDFEDAAHLPKDKVVYVCTGSQGEPRAALARIANDDHKYIHLEDGDVLLFSSRTIPGNEQSVNRIKNRIIGKGVHVVTEKDRPIHVSGHPYRDEIKQLIEWVKPKNLLPVHGEQMQMENHSELAESMGIPAPVVPLNGDVIVIDADGIEKIGEVSAGMVAIDGKRKVALDHEAILMRKRLMYNGSVVVTLVADKNGDLLAEPKITALGLFDDSAEDETHYLIGAQGAVTSALAKLPHKARGVDYTMEETARIAARRYFEAEFDRRPQTRVHLVRV